MADAKYGTMGKALIAQRDEKEYAAFLREQSLSGDHSFLLSAISHSNLRTSVREVLEELITGNLRRPNHRPTTDYTAMKGAFRALRVLDLEAGNYRQQRQAHRDRIQALICSCRAFRCNYSGRCRHTCARPLGSQSS